MELALRFMDFLQVAADIQAFREGTDLEGSQQYQFMKEVFKNPEPGEMEAKLQGSSGTAAKLINRIHLPEGLKREFFPKSHGSHFQFKGTKLTLEFKDKSVLTCILNELRKRDLKYRKHLRKKSELSLKRCE